MSSLHELAAPGAFAGLSEDHEEFRRSVRPFLEKLSPEAEVRRLMATDAGYDPAAWRQMAEQLGLQGLIVPAELGGSGYSFLELGVVLEEMGRLLLCAPFFATVVLATTTLLLAGDQSAQADYLPDIAAGDTVATLALTEDSGSLDPSSIELSAAPGEGGWQLDGVKNFVLDGHVADLLLVAARSPAGISLFGVDGDAPGLLRSPLRTMDQTRKQARLTFAATPARLVGTDGEAWPVLTRVLDLAAVGLAAEQVGGAQKCLEMAVEYAKIRTQFGRLIGSFQAIKHKCADILLEVESAKSAAYHALHVAASRGTELPAVASLVKAWCSETYANAAAENIQIHGGIGFTWEHAAHLYFKRAASSQLLFGSPRHHRLQFADRIGL
jgi:alkylation response protein AidB-like acyl-CoA dehydrogenase